MSASLYSLLAFVLLTMFLAALIAGHRVVWVLGGDHKANDFPADQDHGGSPFYKRVIRAHLNCLENLPLFAAVVLTAFALGVPGLTDPLAIWYIGFRIAQTIVHLLGTSEWLVNLRFGLFVAQYVVLVMMMRVLVV